MSTLVVSVGRNVGAFPMGEVQWRSFREEVFDAVENAGGRIVYESQGYGRYEGQTEESYTVIAETGKLDDQYLEDQLRLLAEEYEQETVAVTLGETRLVGVL